MAQCEMCGKESSLRVAEIDGAELNVCNSCVSYGSVKKKAYAPNPKKQWDKPNRPDFRIVGNFSSLLRESRERKGMSQEDFAKFLEEKQSIVAKWESGALRPRIGIAKVLQRKLGITLLKRDEGKKSVSVGKKVSDEFTLGDFIKVRKRKS